MEQEWVPQEGVGTPDGFARLWTPHRLAYIKGASDTGCPFCRIGRGETIGEPGDGAGTGTEADADADNLVVARGAEVFALLNLHPYNPGHLMVLPYRHVADLEELTDSETAELMDFTRQAVVTMKKVAAPHAFNVGLNLGHVAGGSLAEHIHQHVVPRWGGDANFIAVVGQTKVIPQLLAETRSQLAAAWEPPRRATPGAD
ncbi:HIT family protein [Pseudonocardia sp. Ae168_Ps1]|jgi:ATP adenylyltransferase|uniref:HIT family protein n=1 Tax=unclassified Pseudonocardia TaxID=2619320 RepID=UPI0001FFE549|nr:MULTISPECIES: HIT domain-containing protein [unclassified Pseudonocardia]ALE73172.1 HIT family hydrolase [Pseudonocardia sp. EC080625-04]ALL76499.1 HIT family hydrolase [Pseudonocardia sp. EC080610-09]ALL83524.1 HIT family hydrolase [Pseudonocardia sp. EC080619-01]OLL72628.1 HIT family protein [Pseudonocardia sp. Ae150A_Ps1]OLL78600.1 HIT family protein [Pseudonocardia sp. Ae168_Ps1]